MALSTSPKDCLALIGESLKESKLRYGAATQLQIPQELSFNDRVRVYEFNTESYKILAVIGTHVGTMQITYLKAGKFSQSEAEDIIKRNYPTCEQAVLLSNEGITVEDGLTRIQFSLRPYGATKGDAYLSIGKSTSGLTVWYARKMIVQADSVGLAPRSAQFARSYQKRLESNAADVIRDEWKAINDKVLGATEPSTVLGSGNTSGIMVSVQGGTLPQSSELAGTAVATFQIGRTEVTWAEWKEVRDWAVANGYPDLAGVGQGVAPDHPVQNVNWYDVVKWTNAKSEKSNLRPVYSVEGVIYRTGQLNPSRDLEASGYRLITESEWEWAARGGVKSQGFNYSGSNDLDAVAWYNVIGGGGTKEVAIKLPNELGLYDMSGNVWEWIEDSFWNGRRHRSGSWTDPAPHCRVTFRGGAPETYTSDIVGFRVARNAED